jgi:methionine synthase I (cobalamin-dependent)
MSRFLDALHSGRVLLMDGAMGTELQKAGLRDDENSAAWNLLYPERVRAVHQAYRGAGAEVFLTNTFQANPPALARQGLQDQLEHVSQAGVRLARSGAGPDRFVLADIGPFGKPAPLPRWILPAFRGADALVVETASDVFDLLGILKNIQSEFEGRESAPILFSFTFCRLPNGKLGSATGRMLESCVRRARRQLLSALGVNCGRDISMDDIIEIVRRYRAVTDLPLFARPNAGTPKRDGDRWVYPLAPEAMAARLPELLEAGVSMVGGCCGTTPEHIAACKPIIDAWNARRSP